MSTLSVYYDAEEVAPKNNSMSRLRWEGAREGLEAVVGRRDGGVGGWLEYGYECRFSCVYLGVYVWVCMFGWVCVSVYGIVYVWVCMCGRVYAMLVSSHWLQI